jgi:hypothetical protein
MELSVRFMLWPLYHLEIELPVPTDRGLVGLYSLTKQVLENILFLPEIESRFIDFPARSLITIVTELSCLRNKQINIKTHNLKYTNLFVFFLNECKNFNQSVKTPQSFHI